MIHTQKHHTEILLTEKKTEVYVPDEELRKYNRQSNPDMQTPLDLYYNWNSDEQSPPHLSNKDTSLLCIIYTNSQYYQFILDKIWELKYSDI